MDFKDNGQKYNFNDLVNIVELLRAPGGCPWDREQTHASIKKNVIEEGYELIEAIDDCDSEKIADESGDLLLQVVFHAIIAKDNSEYDIDDVTDAISRKLIHRHPHVFGNVTVSGSGEVLKNWDEIKRKDRNQDSITKELKGVSNYLPSLMRADKIQKKAEKAGYKFNKESSIKCVGDSKDDCGKMLFEMVRFCRNEGVDPELALASYTEKFIDEFDEFENSTK